MENSASNNTGAELLVLFETSQIQYGQYQAQHWNAGAKECVQNAEDAESH